MRTCTLFVLAVTAAVAAFASVCRPAQADMSTTTITATCQAAPDADRYVSFIFCRTHLLAQRGAGDADVWGLAKITAAMGVNHADAARYEIERTTKRGRRDPRIRRALERCDGLYGSARAAFAAAHEALVERRYGDARRSLAGILHVRLLSAEEATTNLQERKLVPQPRQLMPCDDKCSCTVPSPGGAACRCAGNQSGGRAAPVNTTAVVHLRRALLLQSVLMRQAGHRRGRRQGRLHLRGLHCLM